MKESGGQKELIMKGKSNVDDSLSDRDNRERQEMLQ